MSKVKFRVWDKRYKQYVEPYAICLDGRAIVVTKPCNDLETLESERAIIEQDTGLKDKNGKEIYEGNIVRTKSPDRANFNAGAIEMVQQMYLIMNAAHYSDPDICHCEPLGYYCDTELEVIGNIHDNPELLNNKEATNGQ